MHRFSAASHKMTKMRLRITADNRQFSQYWDVSTTCIQHFMPYNSAPWPAINCQCLTSLYKNWMHKKLDQLFFTWLSSRRTFLSMCSTEHIFDEYCSLVRNYLLWMQIYALLDLLETTFVCGQRFIMPVDELSCVHIRIFILSLILWFCN